MAVFTNDDNKILNFRPLCVGAVCFLLGIYCSVQAFLKSNWLIIVLPILAFVLLFALFSVFGKKKVLLRVLVLCYLIIFLLGMGAFALKENSAENASSPYINGQFVGTIDEIKVYYDGTHKIIFRNCTINGENIGSKSLYYAHASDFDRTPRVGETYFLSCEQITPLYEEFKDYIELYQGVHFSISSNEKAYFLKDDSNLFDKIKRYVEDLLSSSLSEQSYPIALALLVGDTSKLGYDALENYQMAGIAHVFAVSGLHVGTLALVLSFVAKRLKLGRVGILIFTAIPLFIYCGVCGFSSSSVRAFIMSICLLLANVMGFKRDGLSVVAIAALIIATYNPVCIFEKGFQLSFVAVISIIILAPIFKRGAKGRSLFSEGISTSLAVQVGTLPIITDMSGYISIISLLCNIIFVPLVMICYQFLMITCGVSLFEKLIFGSTHYSFFISDKMLALITDFIGVFDFKNAVLPANFGFISLIYYLGVIVISDVINLSVKSKVIIGAISATLSIALLLL